MESSTLFKLSLKNETNCKLCLRETDDIESQSQLPTNQLQFNLQDICDIYLVYLKPNLSKILPSFDWSSLEKRNISTSAEFCSSCFAAGQKLLTMNERLKTIQSEIKCFIEMLSEEIIRFRRVTNVLCGSDFSHSENIYSNDASSSGGHFSCESIKEEIYVESEYENEPVNVLAIEEDLYFSDKISTCENQQDYKPSMDEPYSQHGYVDMNNMILQNTKNSIPNATPPKNKLIMGNNVVSRKSIENRQLVICLERLPITAGSKKIMKSNAESKIRSRNRKNVNQHSDPVSSGPKRKAGGKTHKQLFQLEATSKLNEELVKMEVEPNSDFVLDPDIKQRRKFNMQRVLKKVREKVKRKGGKIHFECTPCGMKFDPQTYILHMEAVHGDDPVKCRHCGKEFLLSQRLRRHMETVHPRVHKCEYCPSIPKFKDAYQYEIHQMSHTGEIPYECHDCHEIFSNPKTYCEHQKMSPCAIGRRNFKCDSCDQLFSAKCFLLMHIASGHKAAKQNSDGLLECDICDNIFNKLSDFQSHYSEHTEEYIYYCDICGMGHRSLEIFISHRKTHLGEYKNYTCQFCGKQFKFKENLKAHITYKHAEENVTCEKCENTFQNPRKFKEHLHHCGKSFCCKICEKKFTTSGVLRKHMKLHTNDLKCHVCDKAFTSKLALKIHTESIHLKKRNFVCELCGKAFYHKADSELHLRNHNDEKILECQLCEEKFKYKNHLSDHNREFHDAPLLQCKYCEAQFKKINERYTHYNSVHADVQNKSFKCSVCEMCFDNKRARNNHRKRVHIKLQKHSIKKCRSDKVRISNFKTHMQSHERNKNEAFQCDLCDKRFLKENTLRSHKGKYHKPSK